MSTFKALQRSAKLPLVLLVALLAALALGTTPAMAEFGVERFAIGAQSSSSGLPDLQAGSHPYALTTTFVLNEAEQHNAPQGDLKDVNLELPPGFVGNPNATPKCSYKTFIAQSCSNETAVGLATTVFLGSGEYTATTDPIYNLEASTGVAAQFGFVVAARTRVLLDTSVRAGGDYGLTTAVPNINQSLIIVASKVTIWGVPAEAAHNPWRGNCERQYGGVPESPNVASLTGLREGEAEREGPLYFVNEERESGFPESFKSCPTEAPLLPLLTNPTSCGETRTATLGVDDWEQPGDFGGERTKSASLPALAGCEKLDFSPSLSVSPDGTAGSTPTGLNIGIQVPQEAATSNPAGLTEADVKDTTVTLPAGLQLSPSAADGLQACTGDPSDLAPGQLGSPGDEIGFKGVNPASGLKEFTRAVPGSTIATQAGESEPLKPGENFCPDASKVANVRIKTPLLEGELKGAVYLAAPQNFAAGPLENPFASLVALYLVAEEPERGVLIKLAGKVMPNETTGQLTTTFENTPQLPFSELELEFFGSDRAPLATPASCGAYATAAVFTPWTSDEPLAVGSKPFEITSGPEVQTASGPQKTPCPGSALPFSPSLASGTTNNNAGSFSDLTTTLGREDGQQSIQSLTLHYPPGVSGILAGIPLCGEAEANAGTCSSASEIGETIVSVGLGNDPFSVTGGEVYLTGPYQGAPFGLSIVDPAQAGPFDLQEGRPVVVRAKIEVDPHTAALTVMTDASGEHAIPHIIDGIPLQIKHVNVNIARPGFTFNPTSCDPMRIESTITSAEGASSTVSDPFQVTNCQALEFTPKFAVSTTGHASKARGAGLTAKVTEPTGALGTQANITRVKVDLPKQLPSQLKTLQKACPAKTFEEGFEQCLKLAPHSKVGEALVYTPILPVPLKGPAIFVSHGGEAFPSLTIVLQGYGVTVDLVGSTFIKNGITSTTFKTVPDVPFTSFELTLPQGEYAALGANLPEKDQGNLCGQNLKMPTEFLAQNGAKINESTPISITGCTKAKTLTRSQKLSNALKACHDKNGSKRASCERAARKQYAAVKTKPKRGK